MPEEVVSWAAHRYGPDINRLILRFRESLFTLPVVMVVLCAVTALAALWIDGNLGDSLESWPILATTVAGGRAIATTVAGATITVAAIVFSITALSTQMAANQYSPRVVGGFFEDPFQQAIIGLVVGTFTYCLLVLASLSSAIVDGSAATPSASVTVAVGLGVVSAIGIVGYINHSLRRMQIDSVVRRIAASAIKAIDRHLEAAEPGSVDHGPPPEGESAAVRSNAGGWVVDIDAALALESIPDGSTARVDVRLGEAVSVDDRIVTIWPTPPEDWDGAAGLRRAVLTASERSLDLDPTFGIRQLVDIGLRALSPGVNDPTTAVDVVHHLKTPIRTVLLSDAPRRVYSGDHDRRVFLAETPSRSDYVHSAFSEIRLAARAQPYVLRALIEVLEDLHNDLDRLGLEGRETAVQEELQLTIEQARVSGLPENDLKRVLRSIATTSTEDQASG
ncbi:MAG: DUF2254 domain-containing protein [Acidimicrobiia bacterium]